MSYKPEQALLIVNSNNPEQTLNDLKARFDVIHVLSPRIVVIRMQRDVMNKLASTAGLISIYTETIPPEAFAKLNEAEALLVSGWLKSQQPKFRSADRLAWDTEGFDPP